MVQRVNMGIILSLSRRRGKKVEEEAARERQKKVDELCEVFPMLDKVRIVMRVMQSPVNIATHHPIICQSTKECISCSNGIWPLHTHTHAQCTPTHADP